MHGLDRDQVRALAASAVIVGMMRDGASDPKLRERAWSILNAVRIPPRELVKLGMTGLE